MNTLLEDTTTHDDPIALTIDRLSPALHSAVDHAGWPQLMPVQAISIPYILAQKDIRVQSRTGSGKTGAFILPLLERIDPKKRACQTLILTPTRELATQIVQEAEMLMKGSGINVIAVYGGVGYTKQRNAFKNGFQLVVGTPGRIIDHLNEGNLKLNELRLLVLDEADRMLSVGFYRDIKAIGRFLPPHHINTCMFSATYPPHVMRLANDFLQDPVILSLSKDELNNSSSIEHILIPVSDMNKDKLLVRLLETENPESAIIFCNSRAKVHYVSVVMQRYGYNADELSGDLTQRAREEVLKRVRDGKLRFLVATDVAARGLDIPELSHIIQYEVPEQSEVYVHRAGRTGRAGASGTAIILVDTLEKLKMGKIVKEHKIDIQEREAPTEADLYKMMADRVTVSLASELRSRPSQFQSYLVAFEEMVELMLSDSDGIRALAMLIDDHYDTLAKGTQQKVPIQWGRSPVIDATKMHKIGVALARRLQNRDKLRLQRIQQFEPLVEQLMMSGKEFYLLPMLLADFYMQLGS